MSKNQYDIDKSGRGLTTSGLSTARKYHEPFVTTNTLADEEAIRQEQAEEARIAAEKAAKEEADRIEAEKAEAEILAAQQQEADKLNK